MKLLFIIFIFACFIQCFYYILFYSQLVLKRKPKIIKQGQKGVSIIICAKNEANELKRNIPYWLNQDFECFELLIVDDGSTDQTPAVLAQFEKHDQLRVITNPSKNTNRGKRSALEFGIKNARHNLLLLTDADCVPLSNQWITEMTNIRCDKSIVLGVSIYAFNDYSILSRLVQYETTLTYMQYLTAAAINRPYAGVGRNLMYNKSIFNEAFPSTPKNLLSGDDDLWLKELANANNTTICTDPKSLTVSKGPEGWRAWFKQKHRHYSTGKYYKWKTKIYTGGFLLSKLSFYTCFLLLLIFSYHLAWTMIAFLLTMMVIYFVTDSVQKRIEYRSQGIFTPFFDFFSIYLMVIVGIIATFSPPRKWK